MEICAMKRGLEGSRDLTERCRYRFGEIGVKSVGDATGERERKIFGGLGGQVERQGGRISRYRSNGGGLVGSAV